MKQDKITKKLVIGLSTFFLIFIFTLTYINEISKESKNDKFSKLNGEWITKEDNGVNFSFFFYGSDSLKISDLNGYTNFYRYKIKKNKFVVTNDENVIFEWFIVKKTNGSIVLTDEDSKLILYRNN